MREMRDRRDRPKGVGAGRLIFPVVMLLLIAASCAGYGVQVAQRDGLAAAQYTFILAGILALVAIIMLTVAIRSIRAGHRASLAERQTPEAGGSAWTQARRERGEYYK
jgi:uncharacterized membrane protein